VKNKRAIISVISFIGIVVSLGVLVLGAYSIEYGLDNSNIYALYAATILFLTFFTSSAVFFISDVFPRIFNSSGGLSESE
jgi:hypothetical protein